MIKIPVLLAFCLFSLTLFAQNKYSIKGAVADTDLRLKLVNTTISVLNVKDSILVNLALAGTGGAFTINDLPEGKFILLVTYPDYADYVDTFTLDAAHPTHDFGNLNLRQMSKILQDVIIKGDVAIKIKGDTTVFDAKQFVTQHNAKVEDLLKQLPGIQIDKDGKITANGQAVPKVLVDGEEFFGDDPTLVTKNIRADMVDKVQLYDKKSDQAAFTGVDDGKTTKTINILLKEDKKEGSFGKISGGIGTNGYYEGQALYNKFKKNSKFSIYGTLANTQAIGLGYEDGTKAGIYNDDDNEGDVQFSDDGNSLDTFDGGYSGKGLPVSRTGGVHYDSKTPDKKQSINLNYRVSTMDITGVTTTQTESALPNGVLNNNTSENFINHAFQQKLDATYLTKIDTSTTLKIGGSGSIKTFNVTNSYQTVNTNVDTLLSRNNHTVTNNGTQQQFDAGGLFSKKFKTPRRTFSWAFNEVYKKNQSSGYLNSEIDFYNQLGVQDSVQKVNQYKTSTSVSSLLTSDMTYTEPLSKYLSLVFSYKLSINNSSSNRQSFDQSAPGAYTILDNTYSNNYKYNQLLNEPGAVFNFKKGKTTLNIGTRMADIDFKQVDEIAGTIYKRDYIDWLPVFNGQYKPNKHSTIGFYYNGNTRQPTIDQIQPVKNNNDPQNITIGNPDLKSYFINNMSMYYNSYEAVSGASFNVNASYSSTSNPIVSNALTNYNTAVTTTQYVNLANKDPYNYYLRAGINRKIKPIDLGVGLSGNVQDNVSYSYINGALNQSTRNSYSVQVNLSANEEDKYDFYLFGGPSYNLNRFSLQPQSNNNAPGFQLYSGGQLFFPGKLILGSEINYNYTAKTQQIDANQRTIMSVSINKTFFEEENLKVSLKVNNLFNQDTNFNRNIVANTLTQTTSTGIRRYFMLSVSWDFTKFGTSSTKEEN